VSQPKAQSKTQPKTQPKPGSRGAAKSKQHGESSRRGSQPSSTRVWWIAGAVALVVGVAIIVAAVTAGNNSSDSGGPDRAPAPVAVVDGVTNVPRATIQAVGVGTAANPPAPIQGTPAAGKPQVLYIGAEYCPYCAAERWALANAMSRFGTLSNLSITRSGGSPEPAPNTATLSFYGSSYSSPYLTFEPVEVYDRNHNKLETPTAEQQAIWQQYSPQLSFPFIYLDGRYAQQGAGVDVNALHGKTHEQIAQAMSDPNSAVSKTVIGSANVITAEICNLTKNQPAAVCSVPAITAIQQQVNSAG
jgi:hypothetical protein